MLKNTIIFLLCVTNLVSAQHRFCGTSNRLINFLDENPSYLIKRQILENLIFFSKAEEDLMGKMNEIDSRLTKQVYTRHLKFLDLLLY